MDQAVVQGHTGPRVLQRLDRLGPVASTFLVSAVLLVIYLPSATWDFRINTDAAMAAMPAWNVVEHGTLDLSQHRDFLNSHDLAMHESREIGDAIYSGRNPGVIAWAVPFYAAATPWIGPEPFPIAPSAIAAATASALAMGLLSLVFRELVSGSRAVIAALVAGTATTTWSVSADALWTHGPGQLWIVAAILLLAKRHLYGSGGALAGAILCRPDMAFGAAAMGLSQSWQDRRVGSAVRIGAMAVLGLVVLLVYTRLLFGRWSVLGGYYVYEGMFLDNTVRGGGATGGLLGHVGFHAQRFGRALLDLDQGLLVYSPFLVLLLPGLPRGWRAAPTWVRAAALGGVGHFVAQVVANGWWGGDFFFGYRYPLEALTLWSPLLLVAWREHVTEDRARSRLVIILILVSISWIGYGAIIEPYKG